MSAEAINPTDAAIAVLNRLLKLDAEGCSKLIKSKVETNSGVVSDPDIVCTKKGDKDAISCLGLINGILTAAGGSRVAAMFDEEDRLVGFGPYRPPTPATT